MDLSNFEMNEIEDPASEQTELFPGDEIPDQSNLGIQEATATSEETSDHCVFCLRSVAKDDDTAYDEVLSWIRSSTKSSATLRQYTARRAHGTCVSRQAAGIAAEQGTIEEALDEPSFVSFGDDAFEQVFQKTNEYAAGYNDGWFGNPSISDTPDYRQGYVTGAAHVAAKRLMEDQ